MKFYGLVDENGKVRWHDPDGLIKHVSKFKGQQISADIEKRRFGRSSDQNAYYWAVVVKTISEHLGYETEEVHEILNICSC